MITSSRSTDDVSSKKAATQSHTYIGNAPKYDAYNAVDRNPATCMRTRDIGRTGIFKTLWWKVNLGGVYYIHSIDIIFKNYTGFGMYFFYLAMQTSLLVVRSQVALVHTWEFEIVFS